MYHQYYRLTGRPFESAPDPRYYFESGAHRKAMAYLGYGLAQGEGFIIVTGAAGTGKTMLVDRLMATIDPRRLMVAQIAGGQGEGDDILRLAARALGATMTDEGGPGEARRRIETALHQQARTGRRALLVVDEAQALGVTALEELRLLGAFELGGQPLLQICLIARPAFRERLEESRALERIRERVIVTCHLDPLPQDEVGAYIAHRLTVAGWSGNPQLTPSAHALLAEASGGVARQLNLLASRVLARGAAERLDLIDEHVVARISAPAADDMDRPARAAGVEEVDLTALRALQGEVQALRGMLADVAIATIPQPESPPLAELHARLARAETRLEEQDEVLRRILAKLLEWVERDNRHGPFASRVA
ncbi:MAG TPA: AAA family ATPase [Sphingobium sp.]|nr:AAA family ATPase [Sphingobium sp.]